MMWEFLSTHLAEMSRSSLVLDVMFGDGHVEPVRYPGAFPVTATVATLSHEFYLDFR